jgi:predicted CxxxxCH...CXXCH cytochrome family protein
MATDAIGTGSHKGHASVTGANFDCALCHAGYTKTSTAPATHVNGQINLGFTGTATGTVYSKTTTFAAGSSAYGTCATSVCHGSGTPAWGATAAAPVNGFPFSASQCDTCHSGTATAPFYSTAIPKVTANTDAKVGAHTSHLTSTDSLAAAFACADCHGAVTLNSATHMNGSTNFTFSALAQTGGLTPTYSGGSCANVYCHGAKMPGGDTSGTNRTPVWNVPFLPATLTSAACGTCHGFPPSTASGHPAVVIPAGFPTTASIGTTCSCHDNINPAGNSYANIFVNKALHINGSVEIIGGGACDACHGYPPAATGFAGTQNNWSSAKAENYLGGGGAHTIASHVSKTVKPADGFAGCVKCHNAADHVMTPIAFTPSSNIKVRVNPRYRLESAKQFKYTSNRLDAAAHQTGTCSNVSCHYGATPKWDPAH